MDNKVIEKTREEMEIALRSFQSKIREVSKTWLRKMLIDYFDNKVPLCSISNIMESNPNVLEIYPFDKGAIRTIGTALEKAGVVYELRDSIVSIRCGKFPGQAEASKAYTDKYLSEIRRIYTTAIAELKNSSMTDDESLNTARRLKGLVQSYRRKIGLPHNDNDDDDFHGSLVPEPS